MWTERVFRVLIWLGQCVPSSLRVALMRMPAAAWMRRLSQIHLVGSVVVPLCGLMTGYRMLLDVRAGHRRYALGTYEPEVAALIQSMLKGGETVMDVGANIGYFTLLMARLVGPGGRVIAFEPIPTVYSVLCENLRLNDLHWAHPERKAVTGQNGEIQMQTEAGNPLSFTARVAEGGDLFVTAVSIDRYVEVAGLTRLDLVKIDVEGAEDVVIRGMAKSFLRFRPVVLVEIHANNGHQSEALELLKVAGYELMCVDSTGLTACDTRACGGRVMAQWRS